MKIVFKSTIIPIRDIEDAIRATKKYTKGAFTSPERHPIQGEDFPSRTLTEYYEVYPETELGWDMPLSTAIDWAWGDVTHIDVRFQYDYRSDLAKMIVYGGRSAIAALTDGIPGFKAAVERVANPEIVREGTVKERDAICAIRDPDGEQGEDIEAVAAQVLADVNRVGVSTIPHS